jgi:histone deacetylase 1/2
VSQVGSSQSLDGSDPEDDSGAEHNDDSDPAGADSPRSSVHPPAAVPHVAHIQTRLQKGIKNPKVYIDGTVRYGLLVSIDEPRSLSEAHWRIAIEEEHDAFLKNNTWHLIPSSSSRNLIDCKWVYRIKRRADGTIDRYKTRLVAKGFK